MASQSRKAVIVGASRGLGLGLARAYLEDGWSVIATVRSGRSKEFAQLVDSYPDRLRVETCDVTDSASIAALAASLAGIEASLLFVNSGISNGPDEIVEEITPESLAHLVTTNALGPLAAIHALRHIVARDGVVAVMSSNLASVANNTVGGWEGYRASKAALNTMLRSYAARHNDGALTYLAISPGWVKTDMGGDDAPLDIRTSVNGILQVIEGRMGTPGVAFVNYLGETIAW